jgi:RpiR family carbohydrate utilization transcriptional regulator
MQFNAESKMAPAWHYKIKSIHSSLRSAEKRVADYFTNHSDEIIHFTVTEMAEKCGVSEATVVRTCQQLGYKGFQELKIIIAQDLLPAKTILYDEVDITDSLDVVADKLFQSNINALISTRKIIDTKEVNKAVKAILSAANVYIFAVGTSGPIAIDLQNKLIRIGIPVFLSVDSHVQIIFATHLKKGDVAIGISHMGGSRDIVETMETARQNEAITICITSFSKSPITQVSDIKLFTSAQETKFRTEAITSRVAQLTVTDLLYTYIALAKADDSIRNMRLTEKAVANKKF